MSASPNKSLYRMQVKQYEPPIWFQLLNFFHRYFIRSIFRWILQQITGKTLLERILLKQTKYAAIITTEIERLISEYDLPWLAGGWTKEEEPDLVELVLENHSQESNKKVRKELSRVLARSLKQIREYSELCEEVEQRRKEKYDSSNSQHEKRLLKLWEVLVPDEQLQSRQTKQWQLIGFQGDDPATDFRGMGVLSLDQLIFLAKYDVDNAQSILELSNDPSIGFPMAITGITISSTMCGFLQNGDLKNHFYNTVVGSLRMDDFHHAYCQVFKLFSEVWKTSNPSSIMFFNPIFGDFCSKIVLRLRDYSANLNILDVEGFS